MDRGWVSESKKGENSNRFVEGKAESNLHRGSALPLCASQPKTPLCRCGWQSGAEAQTPKFSPRERTRVSCGNSLKKLAHGNWGCTRKKPGPTREAKHHYWEAHKERGGTTIRNSTIVSTPRQQDTTYRSSWGRCELLPPSRALEAGTGCLFQTRGQTPGPTPTDWKGMGSSAARNCTSEPQNLPLLTLKDTDSFHHYEIHQWATGPTPAYLEACRELLPQGIPPVGARTCSTVTGGHG